MSKTIDDALDPEQEEAIRKVYAALGDNLEARAAFWQIEQGLRGVMLANQDVHAAWSKDRAWLEAAQRECRYLREFTGHNP